MRTVFTATSEGALRTTYELPKAQEDYEHIVKALDIIEKNMADRDMLNVSDKDVLKSSTAKEGAENRDMLDVVKIDGKPAPIGVSPDELLQRAVMEKSVIDAEFVKISSAAQARGKS